MKDEYLSLDVLYSETNALLRLRHNGFELDLTTDEALGLSELLVACVAMLTQGNPKPTTNLH